MMMIKMHRSLIVDGLSFSISTQPTSSDLLLNAFLCSFGWIGPPRHRLNFLNRINSPTNTVSPASVSTPNPTSSGGKLMDGTEQFCYLSPPVDVGLVFP